MQRTDKHADFFFFFLQEIDLGWEWGVGDGGEGTEETKL